MHCFVFIARNTYEITIWIFTWIFKNNFRPFAAPSKCRKVRPAPPRYACLGSSLNVWPRIAGNRRWVFRQVSFQMPTFQGCSGKGTRFRQIFWSQNGAPANIVGHRWNANTEEFRKITSYSLGWPSISLFSGPNCPQTRDLASKISKKFSGGDTPGSPQREGATLSRTHPRHGYTPCAEAQAPPLLRPIVSETVPPNQNLPATFTIFITPIPCLPNWA